MIGSAACIRALDSAASAAYSAQTMRQVDSTRHAALISEHLSQVRIIAKRLLMTLPKHVELDDLVQAGTIGLMDAARKFDASKDVTFSTYAKHRIRGAILDSLRKQDTTSRDMRRYQKKLESAGSDLEQKLQRDVTEPELAEALQIDVDRLRMMNVHLRSSERISASTGPNDDLPPEYPAAKEEQPDSIFARNRMMAVLQRVLTSLPERQRTVVSLYYTNEMTMKEIGSVLRVNESRVSQIHKEAVKSMGHQLRALGIQSAVA